VSKLRFGMIITGSMVLLASYLILLFTFISAYLSPVKAVVVHINNIGEANIELAFLLLSVPCIAYYLKYLRWSYKKKKMWIEVVPDD